jgi:hypothetical protein
MLVPEKGQAAEILKAIGTEHHTINRGFADRRPLPTINR